MAKLRCDSARALMKVLVGSDRVFLSDSCVDTIGVVVE
jgi:hypothetical protein